MGSVGGRRVRRVMARRQFIRRTGTLGLSLAAGPLLAAFGSGAPIQTARAGEGRAELRFVFWGSINERNGVERMIDTFNAANPMIHVTPQYIPTTGDTYTEKLTAMLASGDPPEAAYVTGSVAFAYASAGRLMDLSRYVKSDPSKLLPNAFYRYGNQIIGSSIGEITVLYYNKDLFDAAKAPHPPADPKDAWEWDQFLEIARKLTKDRNGNDATSGRFDPNNIETYGVAFNTANTGYLPLVWSNWGQRPWDGTGASGISSVNRPSCRSPRRSSPNFAGNTSTSSRMSIRYFTRTHPSTRRPRNRSTCSIRGTHGPRRGRYRRPVIRRGNGIWTSPSAPSGSGGGGSISLFVNTAWTAGGSTAEKGRPRGSGCAAGWGWPFTTGTT